MNGPSAIPLDSLPVPLPSHGSATDDTAALTRAAARGDAESFGVLYKRWFGRALTAAHRLTGRDEAFCLDVVQDAMLRAARRIPPLPTEAALGAWLCRVVHRAALDRLRAERRRTARERAAAPQSRSPAHTPTHAPDATPSDSLDDEIAWLRARLRELPPDDLRLLGARFAHGHTLAQVGAALGITGDAAHGRIRRILNRFAHQPPTEPTAHRSPTDRQDHQP